MATNVSRCMLGRGLTHVLVQIAKNNMIDVIQLPRLEPFESILGQHELLGVSIGQEEGLRYECPRLARMKGVCDPGAS